MPGLLAVVADRGPESLRLRVAETSDSGSNCIARTLARAKPSVFEYIRFTREDTLHAALGVIPAFVLITAGHLTVGIAFAIGLLPTSLMGIAPRRKLRLVYGIVGCLFGLGIFLGSLIINAHDVFETALLFLGICFVATVALPIGRRHLAARDPDPVAGNRNGL